MRSRPRGQHKCFGRRETLDGIRNCNRVCYDVDVAKLMAKYLGVELELVPVTGPNRIPYLLTSKVDVLVAIFGITPERARQVQFSIPYSSIDIVLMAPKDSKIANAADLKALKVGVARALAKGEA